MTESSRSTSIQAFCLSVLLFFFLLILSACGGAGTADDSAAEAPEDSSPAAASDTAYTHISEEEAQAMIESGTPGEDYILLDTRQVNVYKHDHIPGAICIPDTDITALADDAVIEELPDKTQVIIVYCQFGGVSKIASEKLCAMGYTNVYEFDGMDYWKGEVEYGEDYE